MRRPRQDSNLQPGDQTGCAPESNRTGVAGPRSPVRFRSEPQLKRALGEDSRRLDRAFLGDRDEEGRDATW
jgi:hypothetical protein